MKIEYNLQKASVELYRLRQERTTDCWADILVDARGEQGRLFIVSDYDSSGWTYFWGACGKPFKQFLLDLDIEYTADKLGQGSWFNLATTVAEIKCRLQKDLDAAEYAEWEGKLRLLSFSPNREDFIDQLIDNGYISSFGYPDLHTDITPLFRRFWFEVWSKFRLILQEELTIL